MKLLREFCIILIFCFLGEIVHRLSGMPIPGNVLGMLLLFAALCLRILKLEMIEEAANFLLNHLAFFFVPAAVGLMTCLPLIKGHLISIFVIIIVTTIIIMAVTAITVQALKRR